ncbi:hypothetical protein AVEN_151729-1 [Araneus ventricosus]|uniref:Uncharacterized protein n=1 Tax=Araneus ventricosus TaxID=182803 RepID=A0A4Y2DN03_ARAVE|nr:hypothetical protein AVEN_151729-1 [Araneus ventricosus]
MTRTTPELAPPLQVSAPHYREGVWSKDGSSEESGFEARTLRFPGRVVSWPLCDQINAELSHNHKENSQALPRHPGTFESSAAPKEIPPLWPTKNSPHYERPCADTFLLPRYDSSSEMGPKSHATFTISHREARLCFIIRQALISMSHKTNITVAVL